MSEHQISDETIKEVLTFLLQTALRRLIADKKERTAGTVRSFR